MTHICGAGHRAGHANIMAGTAWSHRIEMPTLTASRSCSEEFHRKMGGGGVPGWMKPPKPFQPRKISLPPGYKRNGHLEEQECGG